MYLTCRFSRLEGSFHKGNFYSRRKKRCDERCLAFLGSGGNVSVEEVG